MPVQTIEMEVVKKLSITDQDIEYSGLNGGQITITQEGSGVSCTCCMDGGDLV